MPQPARTRGRVSQLGTLNFQPSMTAAVIMPAQSSTTGAGAQTQLASQAARTKATAITGTRAICRRKAASISWSLAAGVATGVVDTVILVRRWRGRDGATTENGHGEPGVRWPPARRLSAGVTRPGGVRTSAGGGADGV